MNGTKWCTKVHYVFLVSACIMGFWGSAYISASSVSMKVIPRRMPLRSAVIGGRSINGGLTRSKDQTRNIPVSAKYVKTNSTLSNFHTTRRVVVEESNSHRHGILPFIYVSTTVSTSAARRYPALRIAKSGLKGSGIGRVFSRRGC
jgi:hypothetical protein